MNSYVTKGVCSRKIDFTVENNKVKKVNFTSGCPGNLEGISKLVEGMEVKEVIERLKGIKCGFKSTSCPDQLSKALEKHIKKIDLGA
ncbi:MAG: TIGR03905 family TSCPD domain-containing protein [Firmicutes bacterium]|nr:TIGR03905 family TSCPD domain-containing protein [Bacillota bacterium]